MIELRSAPGTDVSQAPLSLRTKSTSGSDS